MRRGRMLVVCLALGVMTPAFGQETKKKKSRLRSRRRRRLLPPSPPRSIEEIVVTAQKKEESIQDVPISITALEGSFLQEAGIDDFHELAEFTPNVRFTTNACCTTVFIRGFGTPFAAGAFDPTVGLALDELSIAKEIYMSDPLFDIERFEVLRGPQGTLFGKNTPAGLFNVTTASPSDEFEGYVLGGVGGLGVHRLEAALGGPLGELGDLVRFRLAAVDLDGPGDVENTALDVDEPATEQQAGRLKLEISAARRTSTSADRLARAHGVALLPRPVVRLPRRDVEFLRGFDPEFEDDPFNHQNSIDHRRRPRARHRSRRRTSATPEDFGPSARRRSSPCSAGRIRSQTRSTSTSRRSTRSRC